MTFVQALAKQDLTLLLIPQARERRAATPRFVSAKCEHLIAKIGSMM